MASDTQITIVGNVVEDPELKFVGSGAAVTNFRIASTPRRYDKTAGEWVDGEPLFLTVNVWRQMAEHVAETLSRGSRVVVVGTLKSRTYETREGEKRTVFEVEAEEVAPSLRFATARIDKAGAGRSGGGYQPSPTAQPATTDPWGGPSRADEAPF